MTARCLSVEEAARHCGVSVSTFEAAVRPHVPPIRLGRRCVWDIKALDRWLDAKAGITPDAAPKGSAYEQWQARRRREA